MVNGDLSSSQARTLLSLESEKERKKYLDKLLNKEVNIREIEKKAKSNKHRNVDTFINDVCEKLTNVLDAKVKIVSKKKGGKIEINYINDDDLQRLVDSMMNIYEMED